MASWAPTTRRRSPSIVAKAKELLAKAGYPNGFNVTMDVTNKTETRELSASLQNTMAKAGINLIIKVNDNKTTLTKYRASEHDIYLGQWGSDYLDPHSNADGYLKAPLAKRNQWQSPERDAAVLAARDEKDGAKRAQMYMDLQKMALDESPYRHHVPAGRDRVAPQERRRLHHRPDLRSQPLQERRKEVTLTIAAGRMRSEAARSAPAVLFGQ